MAELAERASPGDLIEIFRGPYKHWAVYVGHGYVVHLTSAGAPGDSCSCSVNILRAVVKKELLQKVAKGDKYRVNNSNDTNRCPKSKEEIVQTAERMVGEEIDYSLGRSNCEHFANFLRYGTLESKQAEQVNNVLQAGMLTVGGLVGAVLAGKLIYELVKGSREEEEPE
ncbi:phospholipase A and acyltransferase 2-like isoform X2 [Hemicordylus capensis]|uniref:phospholipase A and acyltransferase 2-like isoform X2 n=1 Tax=Hemicordylus capensis TaxID=884348 RepID=UPI0023029611|nr:phospholipase A and acyltransferase 2-like isoform X2 [Hemicordylus capensis]